MPRAMPARLIREIVDGFGAAAARLETAGPGRRGGRGLPRLPAVAVPQPADEPAHRRVGRRRDGPAAVPARGAGRVPGGDATRVRGGAADLDRRGDARGPDRGRGARRAGGARRRRRDRLRERRRRARRRRWRARTTSCRRSPIANGYTAPLAAPREGASSGCPVMVAGRINQPQEAEAILAAGHADAVRHDPGAHLRPGAARQDRAGAPGRHPGVHRLQPGLHRPLPRRATRSRASSSPRAGGSSSSPAGEPRVRPPRACGGRARRAGDRRRAGRAQGGGGRGGARPPGHARRGGALGRRPGAAGPAAARARGDGRRDHQPRRRGASARASAS